MTKPRIGFIGLCVVGSLMAGHLAKAGFALAIHDILRIKADALAAEHTTITVAGDPREVGEMSNVVITMVRWIELLTNTEIVSSSSDINGTQTRRFPQ